MNSHNDHLDAAEQKPSPVDPLGEFEILKNAQILWQELSELTSARLQLVALETQQAGRSLIEMIVISLILAGLMFSSWMGVLTVAVIWLIAHGLLVSSAILLAVAFNLMLTLILMRMIRLKSQLLAFPASMRMLRPDRSIAGPTKTAEPI